MVNIIDARGRSCPEPVIITKNAIEQNPGGNLNILVDTHVAVENITRFVISRGYKIKVIEKTGEFEIQIKK